MCISRTHKSVNHHIHYLVWGFCRNTDTYSRRPQGSGGAYNSWETKDTGIYSILQHLWKHPRLACSFPVSNFHLNMPYWHKSLRSVSQSKRKIISKKKLLKNMQLPPIFWFVCMCGGVWGCKGETLCKIQIRKRLLLSFLKKTSYTKKATTV